MKKNVLHHSFWATFLPFATCKLLLLSSFFSALLVLLSFSLPVKKSEQLRVLLLFSISHCLQRPQLRKQNKSSLRAVLGIVLFNCLHYTPLTLQTMKSLENRKRLSNSAVMCLSDLSLIPLLTLWLHHQFCLFLARYKSEATMRHIKCPSHTYMQGMAFGDSFWS